MNKEFLGVLCQNDWVAIQVYNCCKALDISVPNEMCIMGFDNISELDEMDGGNKIITVEQNFFELGVKAGETVLREINGEMPGIKYIVPVKNCCSQLNFKNRPFETI